MSYPQQPFGPPGTTPPAGPKQKSLGQKLGIGCAGLFGLILLISIISAVAGGSDGGGKDGKPGADSSVVDTPVEDLAEDTTVDEPVDEPVQEETTPAAEEKPAKVVFKVWGTAPSGVEITYGSDGTNLDASGLPVTKTMKFSDDAMYYVVNAQLMGGGDIHCSVTVNGQTKKAQARGGYNICWAQLSYTGLGWD